MHKLYELKETLCDELEQYGGKGKLSAGDLEIVDKLSHAIKNLDKIIESYEESGYSEDGKMMGDRYVNRRYSMRRDSRGRYARDRYAMDHHGMIEELHELMKDAPDERTKQEFRRFIDKMENM